VHPETEQKNKKLKEVRAGKTLMQAEQSSATEQ
jgi:hypothetical protein